MNIIMQIANEKINNIESLIMQYLNTLTPIIILIIVAVILGLILDRVSQDRVIKLFKENWVVLFYEDVDKNGLNEAYLGKIHVPPRSEGGFEIEYAIKAIENPLKLIAFLKRAYTETGNNKYLDKANEIYKHLKKDGRINIDFEDIKYDPFTEPSQASKKVYKNNINEIYSIVRFEEYMNRKELEKKKRELGKIFHPGTWYRTKRSIVNFLSLVKDKLKDAFGVFTSTIGKIAPVSPGVSKEVERYGKEAIGKIGSYEALLETSIGKLVKVMVNDIDKQIRFYNGVLREYSPNYIAVYNVDFPIDEEAVFKGSELMKNFPRERLDFHGWRLNEPQHIKVINYHRDSNKLSFDLQNIYDNHIYVEKMKIADQEITLDDPNFTPNEIEHVKVTGEFNNDPEIHVVYKIIKKADVIWPASKAKVVGSGEPTENLIEGILRIMKKSIEINL